MQVRLKPPAHSNGHKEAQLAECIDLALRRVAELIKDQGVSDFQAAYISDNAQSSELFRNTCKASGDRTNHAEMVALRKAEDRGVQIAALVTSHFPCPMCLTAAFWCQVRYICSLSTVVEAERLGFPDGHLYSELALANSFADLEFSTMMDGQIVPVSIASMIRIV